METVPCNLFSWSDLRQQRGLQAHIKASNYCFVWIGAGVWNATPATQSGPNYNRFNNIPRTNLLYYNSLKFTMMARFPVSLRKKLNWRRVISFAAKKIKVRESSAIMFSMREQNTSQLSNYGLKSAIVATVALWLVFATISLHEIFVHRLARIEKPFKE